MATDNSDPIGIRCLTALVSMTREQVLECLDQAAEEANAGDRGQVNRWMQRLASLTAAAARWFEQH